MEKVSLDREIILNATEDTIRKYGPDKANISDVAKSLNVSHAALYRYYKSKSELWDAVTDRWLSRLQENAKKILEENTPADKKLFLLLEEFAESKHKSENSDPEMFAIYSKLVQSSTNVIEKNIEKGILGIKSVIDEGIDSGVFKANLTSDIATSVYLATSVFIQPNTYKISNRKEHITSVITLLIDGLRK